MVLCLMGLCVAPLWGNAETSPPKEPAPVVEDSRDQIDLATFGKLEQQLIALETLIEQQTERLVVLHDRLAVETDTTRRQQIDGLITRLTTLLDALEEQRDILDEQIATLRPLVTHTGPNGDN